jgi:hypothetical protein
MRTERSSRERGKTTNHFPNAKTSAFVAQQSILCFVLGALLVALGHSAEAQQSTKIPRIGVLTGGSASANTGRHEAFRQGLGELGYVEGKSIIVEWRNADAKIANLSMLAAELVRLKVDVIVTDKILKGSKPRRPTCGTTDESRVYHQSENSEADRSDNSADSAGESGSSDQVRREECRVPSDE